MNRGIRYRQQLKRCGFRGWKKANNRRRDLIDIDVKCGGLRSLTDAEQAELSELQKLADLFIAWKMQKQIAFQNARFRRLEKIIEKNKGKR